MRLLVRVAMATTLIMADAAQAASLTATPGRSAEDPVSRYEARLQGILDRDARNWKRLSASICSGCGAPPPPSDIASATPLYIRAQREAAAAISRSEAAARKPAAKAAPIRSAALPGLEERGRAARPRPSAVRSAKARRHARYARLRMIRHQRHMALLQARRRQAFAVETRHRAHRIRLAGLGIGTLGRGADHAGGERRPRPLPPQRPVTLCADDRGLDTTDARSSSACMGPR
jgi:hypothetical protein